MLEQTLRLSPWGNSQGIRLPKSFLDQIGVRQGKDKMLNAKIKDGEIIITKARSSDMTLKEMFEGFDADKYFAKTQGSKELDWGKPVGKEIWDE